MNPKITTAALWLVCVASSLFAQDQHWQLVLSSGKSIPDVALQRLEGDSLVVSHAQVAQAVLVDSIVELRQAKKSKFWKGAGIGLAAGVVSGALIGWAADGGEQSSEGEFALDTSGFSAAGGAVIGGITGVVVGGVIGVYAGRDEVHDLAHMNAQQKRQAIALLVPQQK